MFFSSLGLQYPDRAWTVVCACGSGGQTCSFKALAEVLNLMYFSDSLADSPSGFIWGCVDMLVHGRPLLPAR